MEVETILIKFQSIIKEELHKLADQNVTQLCHSHPPVSYVVTGCPYCEKYGNCFIKTDFQAT